MMARRIKTVGDLVNLLHEVHEAKEKVAEAHQSIAHGGNDSTMSGKLEQLTAEINWLHELLDTPIIIGDSK